MVINSRTKNKKGGSDIKEVSPPKPNILERILDVPDISDLLKKKIHDSGVPGSVLYSISKNLKEPFRSANIFDFTLNSKKFIKVANKDYLLAKTDVPEKYNTYIESVGKPTMKSLQSNLDTCLQVAKKAVIPEDVDDYYPYKQKIKDIIAIYEQLYSSYLYKYKKTKNFIHILEISKTLNKMTRVLYIMNTLMKERNASLQISFFEPIYNKYAIMGYEFNKVCLATILYSNDYKKIGKAYSYLHEIDYTRTYYSSLYNNFNHDNDVFCINGLKYFHDNSDNTFKILKTLVNKQTIIKKDIFQKYIPIMDLSKQSLLFRKEIYKACMEYMYIKEGLRYQVLDNITI